MRSRVGTEAFRSNSLVDLLCSALRPVMVMVVAVIQQLTEINVSITYAPMILEYSCIGTNVAIAQAVVVGLAQMVFTYLATATVDRFGRKPLRVSGMVGISISPFAFGDRFRTAAIVPKSLAEPRLVLVESESRTRAVEDRFDTGFTQLVPSKRSPTVTSDERLVLVLS